MELNELRGQIDEIDAAIIALLEQRMDVAAAIADCKARMGRPTLDRAREAQKLDAVRARCRPETADGIAAVFESVMAASREHQARRREDGDGR